MTQTHDLKALVARAHNVRVAVGVRPGQLSSREAARVLGGVMSWIARTDGSAAMHRTASELALHDEAWSSSFRDLPLDVNSGEPNASIHLVAAVCRGLLEIAGAANLRDALSFWASEHDPVNWLLV